MAQERGEATAGGGVKATKAGRFLGSLKDALVAASRDDSMAAPVVTPAVAVAITPVKNNAPSTNKAVTLVAIPQGASPNAEDAARLARTMPVARSAGKPAERPERRVEPERHIEFDAPPTTRVLRPAPKPAEPAKQDRTVLVRGRQAIARTVFDQDPVVGFLVVVGGPGLGSFRPVFEGNNTLGRSADNRVPLDFGDDTISAEAQAYVRYDSNDRSFLFVPNLAKTNVVSVNDKRPTGAVELKAMDVITLGRTQVAFVPFCGSDFDWSEISET